MSEPVISVRHSWQKGILELHLEEHDAICDLMEEVLGHTELATLEDLLIRTHENTMGLYTEVDLDEVRSQIPESAVQLAQLTEDEALSLAWDLVQAVKKMRQDAITRLSLVK
jgi:hypothetical protein